MCLELQANRMVGCQRRLTLSEHATRAPPENNDIRSELGYRREPLCLIVSLISLVSQVVWQLFAKCRVTCGAVWAIWGQPSLWAGLGTMAGKGKGSGQHLVVVN